MIEKRRMCLACGNALQQAGIPCELLGGGVHGMCPHCKKKRLCYNWKVERRERFTSSALRAPAELGTSHASRASGSPQGEGYKEGNPSGADAPAPLRQGSL